MDRSLRTLLPLIKAEASGRRGSLLLAQEAGMGWIFAAHEKPRCILPLFKFFSSCLIPQ
jgi:hypothetical protein